MRRTASLITTAFVLVALAAQPVQAGHAHGCGTISNGKNRVFASNGMKCKFARKWSKRYLRNGSRPDGYACARVGTRVRFHCHRKRNNDVFYYVQKA
jgi:hypothetical protein